jgi:hypothetical protein
MCSMRRRRCATCRCARRWRTFCACAIRRRSACFRRRSSRRFVPQHSQGVQHSFRVLLVLKHRVLRCALGAQEVLACVRVGRCARCSSRCRCSTRTRSQRLIRRASPQRACEYRRYRRVRWAEQRTEPWERVQLPGAGACGAPPQRGAAVRVSRSRLTAAQPTHPTLPWVGTGLPYPTLPYPTLGRYGPTLPYPTLPWVGMVR